ncbi:hypothetical protein BpHYR1_010689 [Brachionus plicatilis]|uniref:Uncharacterized protein n=1 Tax=Brachionus plicatilis TaxID=10195 RepID=A0A3M7SVM1_BRAPC|nr:hypothetical protein BpHYR1_010689 [Brachionus plicatilis]
MPLSDRHSLLIVIKIRKLKICTIADLCNISCNFFLPKNNCAIINIFLSLLKKFRCEKGELEDYQIMK